MGAKITKIDFLVTILRVGLMISISEQELVALFQQGVAGNSTGFTLLARRFVSSTRKTNPEVAEKLLELVASPHMLRGKEKQPPTDRESSANLLSEQYHVVLKEEPLWSKSIADKLAVAINERKHEKKLLEAGLEPIKSMLFTGPPGVGKTLGASWLAQKMNLPIFTLDLSSVMSSLLGKTGANIKNVFSYAASMPCVLFLDEFDAVAKKRDDDRDVGELKRLVNVLLQAIDSWPSTSLLIAATNHPELLDRAIWRRFDKVVEFDLPNKESVEEYFKKLGVSEKIASKISLIMTDKSYSDLNKIASAAKKMSVLEDVPLDDAIFKQAIFGDVLENPDLRTNAIRGAVSAGVSRRKVAELTGMSHPTISKIVNNKGDV